MKNRLLFILAASLAMLGCDKGVSPEIDNVPAENHGISGTVYFRNWPPQDSIKDLRLVVFQQIPVGSNIVNEVMAGRAKYTDPLGPYGADSINYTIILNPLPADTMPFIAVGQQYGTNIQTDWRMVGVYQAAGDSIVPGKVTVYADSIVNGINIYVDFLHIPPQP